MPSARLLLLAALLVLPGCSPPGMLNTLDSVYGTGSGVERVREAVAFGSHGQTLDVWRPENSAGKALPVIIFWYGGGWVKGTRQDYGFAARALAAEGFVVVVPDYRKVPSVRFPAFLQDGAEAVKWTRDNIAASGGDTARIALNGHSAGAYTAIMLALDTRWLRAEGVDPGIVKAAVGLCGPYDFYPWTSNRAVDAMQGVADPQMTQPIRFARADAPPLMLITATEDVTVRPRNAINLAARMKAVGGRAELRNYEGLDHEDIIMAVSKPFRGKGPILADSVRFLNDSLAVSGEPAGRR